MKIKRILIPLIAFLTFGSCTDFLFFGDSNSSSKISEMNLKEVAISIDRHVGDAKADNISQCDVLPVGAKPCGGPWGYLVYSRKMSSKPTLKKLIERYDELDEIRNIEEGRISTCEMAGEPALTIKKRSCRGEGHYAWNPGDILEWNGIEE